ncbi:DNA-binding protein [Marinospirillum insulare]|uniref:Helix-turn-helix domain-containing protein n=1 Tax=Marinospirillum insulare TaxID=217169 RepID=A0ABQ5ZT30_9GAMM|nr:DNA-binding protein [Marinospirillum insulare]GLR62567.1 hypothetical protein GCM10007878_00020 [Marinospirillum insulare]
MNKPNKSVNTSALADNPIPVMTLKKFAAESGLALAGPTVVNGMVQRKALPTVKIGKHRMIDMDALRLMLEKQRDSSC